MKSLKNARENLTQIFAITEKHIKLSLRFKLKFILNLMIPIISILMPLIVLDKFFDFNVNFGPWNGTNYLVYQFTAFNFFLMSNIMNIFPSEFYFEKFWKTLPNLVIAPFNRFNLLLGIFFAHLLLISLPFTLFFILCYLYYPISILTIIFIIGIYILIAFIFSGIGLAIGTFAISNENIMGVLEFFSIGVIWLSCITYPFQIFPPLFQRIINLNPLYYIFDFLRLSWINDDLVYTMINYPFNFFMLVASAIIIPLIGILLFNYIFKKYGIVGY